MVMIHKVYVGNVTTFLTLVLPLYFSLGSANSSCKHNQEGMGHIKTGIITLSEPRGDQMQLYFI
jgi:hypothetical protein